MLVCIHTTHPGTVRQPHTHIHTHIHTLTCTYTGTTAKKKGRRAKVTFSYAADNEDELTLTPGKVCNHLFNVILLYETSYQNSMLFNVI